MWAACLAARRAEFGDLYQAMFEKWAGWFDCQGALPTTQDALFLFEFDSRMRELDRRVPLDEDAFRTTESLGIDLSRPERGTDEEDERRREPAF